jgi:polysaccharide pyruvyl transferase WcaK-like protein
MAKEYEKKILFENMQQRLLEMLGDYLDDQDLQIDKAIAQLKDPVNMEDSELHIRMAKAAVDEVKKIFIDANGSSTCL